MQVRRHGPADARRSGLRVHGDGDALILEVLDHFAQRPNAGDGGVAAFLQRLGVGLVGVGVIGDVAVGKDILDDVIRQGDGGSAIGHCAGRAHGGGGKDKRDDEHEAGVTPPVRPM